MKPFSDEPAALDSSHRAIGQQIAAATGPYADTAPAMENRTRLRFRMIGEVDPQLPTRVLVLLTLRGAMPLQFDFTWHEQEALIHIRFELQADTVLYSEKLLDQLLKFPTTREVNLLPPA